jgi:hypothetical protein
MKHKVHILIPEEEWRLLKDWCNGSPTNITPSAIHRALLRSFIESIVKPDFSLNQFATADYEKLSQGLVEAIKAAPTLRSNK